MEAITYADGSKAYVQTNGHGDITELRNANGELLNKYQYDLWGNIVSKEEKVHNPFRYSGELWDDTTELQYLRARWYDPSLGRFITEDTFEGDLQNPMTQNGYVYAGNNALIYVDPSGNVWKWVGDSWKVVKKAGVATANFLILDDLKTFIDPKSSLFDRGMAVAGFLPVGKVFKGGKLIVKWSNKEGKVVNKATTTTTKVVKACNCFTAGTTVQTDEGEKPIEKIEVGDKVLAKDDETGEMAYKEVEWLYQRNVEETYNITVGGEISTTTNEHPFWIVGKYWVEAQYLTVDDVLTTSDGKELAIEKIEVKKEHNVVYNFKVKDFHTYFVSNLGVWTHNSCDVPNTTTKWDIKTGADKKIDYRFNGSTVSAYRDPNTGLWWAKDTTGHADSAFKVFKEAKGGKELHWLADSDEYGNFIKGKHKSSTGTVIKIK